MCGWWSYFVPLISFKFLPYTLNKYCRIDTKKFVFFIRFPKVFVVNSQRWRRRRRQNEKQKINWEIASTFSYSKLYTTNTSRHTDKARLKCIPQMLSEEESGVRSRFHFISYFSTMWQSGYLKFQKKKKLASSFYIPRQFYFLYDWAYL